MIIDISFLVGWISALTALIAPAWVIMRKINAFLKRVDKLESWTLKQQHDIERTRAEMTLLLTGTLACLKGLKEQGCNGEVTKSIAEIERFLLEQAAKTRSAVEYSVGKLR